MAVSSSLIADSANGKSPSSKVTAKINAGVISMNSAVTAPLSLRNAKSSRHQTKQQLSNFLAAHD
jgi:hypothetical protein